MDTTIFNKLEVKYLILNILWISYVIDLAISQSCTITDGPTLKDGTVLKIDACHTYNCSSGLLHLVKPKCPELHECGWVEVPQGECCGVCKGCLSKNSEKLYENGDDWQETDCVRCKCVDGHAKCQAQMCARECRNPRKIPGQCCPVCDVKENVVTMSPHCKPFNCSLICYNGMMKDTDGCYICQCNPEMEVSKPEVDQSGECELECPHGYVSDEFGLDLCECNQPPPECPDLAITCTKTCPYGYRIDKHGCERCRCNRCPPFECKKKCADGYVYNDQGCKLCKCIDPTARPNDKQLTTPPIDDIEGRKCMSLEGRQMEEGEMWFDGCRRCFCYDGYEFCSLMTCPAPKCKHPVIKHNDCCPTCPDDTGLSRGDATKCHSRDGSGYAEGESWMLDKCTRCMCHHEGTLCQVESCPPLLCVHPIQLPDACCPICPDPDSIPRLFQPPTEEKSDCISDSGAVFRHMGTWRSTPCQSCTCSDGTIHCFSQTCPLLDCSETVVKKGQCCPSCKESEKPQVCVDNGVTYWSGETWFLADCVKCSCHNRNMICTEISCDNSTNCPYWVHIEGQCCPVCQNSTEPPETSTLSTTVAIGQFENTDKTWTNDERPGEPRLKNDYFVIIVVLASLVGLMACILLIVLLRYCIKRSRSRRHNIKLTSYVPTEVKKRPKSTNLEWQGNCPLMGDKKPTVNVLVDAKSPDNVGITAPQNTKLNIDEENFYNRYSYIDENTGTELNYDKNNYRKSM